MLRVPIRLIVCASILIQQASLALCAQNNDYSFLTQTPRIDNFQPDYNRRLQNLDLEQLVKPTFQLTDFLAPDLNINAQTLRLPEIQVRDLDTSVWTYKNEGYHFDRESKRFDSYAATIHPNTAAEANSSVAMELGKMKFNAGRLTPQSYTRTYRDELNNSLQITRTDQVAESNPSFQKFVTHFEQQGHSLNEQPGQPIARPENPTRELITSYEERWVSIGSNSQGGHENRSVRLTIDSIDHDSNLHRFVSGYHGTIQNGQQNLEFTVLSPHDIDGKIESLNFEITAKGAPAAHISWKPTSDKDSSKSFDLLRDNLPIPVLVGPRSSFRFNNVDIAEAPLKVTKDGAINSNQVGNVSDLANLMGKEDLGITVGFTAPDKASIKNGFSLGNAVRNLWYMATGRWSEVKGLRQEMSSLQAQSPAKFVLAAGFNDPSFMSLKDLRGAMQNVNSIQMPATKQSVPTEKIVSPEIILSGSDKITIPVSAPLADASSGNQMRLHIRQEGDQYVLSNGKVGSVTLQALGVGAILTVEGKTEFPTYGMTVYAGKIQLEYDGIKMGPNTLFQTKEGTFYFSKQLGVIPAVIDGDHFSIAPANVKLENGKTFQFADLKLEGTIDRNAGRANLSSKSYRSDASINGNPSAPDVTYAVTVHGNKIAMISTLYKDAGLPQPDQSYKVEPGMIANSYYFAQSEASNSNNSFVVRSAYLTLQAAAFPVALAEQAITYTMNMPYFASQGGQYAARASLQKNWSDKALDGLQAVAAFSNAFVAAEPYGVAAVNIPMKISAVIAQQFETGLAMRLNPMNYSVEAPGLGMNGGNVKVRFLPTVADQSTSELVESAISYKFPAIQTPYGIANQSNTAESLAARVQVDNGATLYRIGTMGKSQTAEGQFWSLEHPLSVDFEKQYGVPSDNLVKPDFIEMSVLKPGTPFITRPAAGFGENPGGAIEVVVPKNGVIMKSFSTTGDHWQ